MSRVVGLLICFALIGAYEFPKLWRRQNKYERWVYSSIFLLSAAYCSAYLLEVPLPDPNGLIRLVFGGIGAKLMQTTGS